MPNAHCFVVDDNNMQRAVRAATQLLRAPLFSISADLFGFECGKLQNKTLMLVWAGILSFMLSCVLCMCVCG